MEERTSRQPVNNGAFSHEGIEQARGLNRLTSTTVAGLSVGNSTKTKIPGRMINNLWGAQQMAPQ